MPSSYTLGDHFEAFIEEQLRGGRYATASEVIRDGLRLLEGEQQRRQAELDGLRREPEKRRRSSRSKSSATATDRLERTEGKIMRRPGK
jgi:antitoxin ParD1/3/4